MDNWWQKSRRASATRACTLATLTLALANAGDVEGLVALYEPGAVLAAPSGRLSTGHDEIRRAYAELLADRPSFSSRASSR